MGEVFQQTRADGSPNWGPGQETWQRCWEIGRDDLRFHRGKGFAITNRATGQTGPVRRLSDIGGVLAGRMETGELDTVFVVRSEGDHYAREFRRHQTAATKAERVIAEGVSLIGTPYVYRGTDCSWLTQHCYGLVGIDLPHNAAAQHQLFKTANGLAVISRSQIRPGDLLWHEDDAHVSIFLDEQGFGRVIDTEPHSTGAPAGWPTPTTGVGVRIRPMNPGYYTDWANVCGIGRAIAVNGKP